MIIGKKELTADQFMNHIFPHAGITMDSVLADFNRAINEEKDYILIFRDYEITIKNSDVLAWLEKNGSKTGDGPNIDPIDSLLPAAEREVPETPAEAEARAIAAKHPKPKAEFPSVRPGKKAPAPPDSMNDL